MSPNNEEEYVIDFEEDKLSLPKKFQRGTLKEEDLRDVFDLLNLAQAGVDKRNLNQIHEKGQLDAVEFGIPRDISGIRPLISVDGSYCFLFSFSGTDTWLVLFRVAVSRYIIKSENGEFKYTLYSPPQIFDKLDVLSFNETILNTQPPIYTIAAKVAEGFQQRKAQIFATNIMLYFEDLTLEKVSAIYSNEIILKDGPLFSYRGLNKKGIYNKIKVNCAANNNYFAAISKSTSTHFFNKYYTDDSYLKKFYDEAYSDCVYFPISEERITSQMKDLFDVFGEVYFARLHHKGNKWFRVDVGNDNGNKKELFSSLAVYSMVQLMPGYPIGLIEAHKIAKSVRDFKITYELELLDELQQFGLTPEEILNGAVDFEGREYNSFHELLDQLSR